MTDETRRVEPDPLLMCFASALALEPVPPIILKGRLEAAGFLELGKITIDELARLFVQSATGIDERIKPVRASSRAVEQDSIPEPTEPVVERLQRAYDNCLALLHTPKVETIFWRSVLKEQAVAAPIASDFARQLTTSFATQRITELTSDLPRDLLTPAAETRRTLLSLQPKPPHRPTSSMNKKRFRTASVAAAELRRQQLGAGSARAWVATQLNRDGLRLGNGALFEPKTIENWSSKGQYDADLLKGMRIIAASPLPEGVPTEWPAVAAAWIAIAFGQLAEKTP